MFFIECRCQFFKVFLFAGKLNTVKLKNNDTITTCTVYVKDPKAVPMTV